MNMTITKISDDRFEKTVQVENKIVVNREILVREKTRLTARIAEIDADIVEIDALNA